jgi:hypothetical protein
MNEELPASANRLPPCFFILHFPSGTVATVGFPDIGFNAKTQSRQDARQTLFFFAPWHLCVFALIFSVGAGFGFTNTLAHRTGFV